MVVQIKETRPISVSDSNDNHKPTKSYNNPHFTFVCMFYWHFTYIDRAERPILSNVVVTADSEILLIQSCFF